MYLLFIQKPDKSEVVCTPKSKSKNSPQQTHTKRCGRKTENGGGACNAKTEATQFTATGMTRIVSDERSKTATSRKLTYPGILGTNQEF